MEQRYNLTTLPVLNSMHDQRIQNVELRENILVLHYIDLHYADNSKYHSCDVIFNGVEDADVVAEVREREGLIVTGTTYYNDEFLDFINDNNYSIETINFYCGYRTVIIEAALVDLDGRYCEDCVIEVSANEILYRWQ